jgi:hypothetical protein
LPPPKIKQHVYATLGQMDALLASGKIDDLARSLAKFSPVLKVIDAQREGSLVAHRTLSIGPELVFQGLWSQLGIDKAIKHQLAESRCRFPVGRAIFLTALHRLFDPGSERAAES